MAGRTLISVCILAVASAHCPNACTGHGVCVTTLLYGEKMGGFEVCDCFKGWIDADCSERTCPYDVAWAERPDQNADFHHMTECSSKGVCDRTTGECDCFQAYTGKACQRSTCPNDCSGHGTCEYIEELEYVPLPVEATGISYRNRTLAFGEKLGRSWEYHKYRACKCDGGWTDVDCSRRMCPRGNDVMDERADREDSLLFQIQNITLFSGGTTGNGTGSAFSDFQEGSFAVSFISLLNESFTTHPLRLNAGSDFNDVADNLASDLEDALYALPNKVVDQVRVNVSFGFEERSSDQIAFMNLQVEMVGEHLKGRQNILSVEAEECMYPGCTPKIEGLNLATYGDGERLSLSYSIEKQAADYNTYECGRRGRCDYSTGICDCFSGFTGQACDIQTALT